MLYKKRGVYFSFGVAPHLRVAAPKGEAPLTKDERFAIAGADGRPKPIGRPYYFIMLETSVSEGSSMMVTKEGAYIKFPSF